ncbi:MAG: hypothetical protein ABIS59_00020, partial [Candidatus Saccharibacteria bacterium]
MLYWTRNEAVMLFRRKKKLAAHVAPTPLVNENTAATGTLIATRCGHPTEVEGEVSAFGKITHTQMPSPDGEVEFCLACIGDMAIRCAWCGEVIFIGDPVTLYSPERGFKAPEYAVEYKNGQFVGCLSWDCADTGGDRSG